MFLVNLIQLSHHRVQNGSEAHSASSPMGTGDHSPGVKWRVLGADHLPPSSAEVKNSWSCTSASHTS